MNRPLRILRNLAIGLAGLIVVAIVTAILVVQTDWFRNYVRAKIITATEEGTGGKVEVRSFYFDWRKLEAIITGFVIHGKEPAGAPPFARADRVQVNLRLFTSLRRILDVSFLGIERPETNILVFADGTTNIPQPRKRETDTTILDTVIDLAVDSFRITDGRVTYNSKTQAIDVRGNNLRAQLWFNLLTQSYKGELSLQPIYVVSGRNTPVVFTVTLPVVLERNRVGFDGAKVTTPASNLTINGSIENLKDPKITARVNGHAGLTDLKNLANVPIDVNARNAPSRLLIDGNAAMADNRIFINALRLSVGSSNIEASGTLKDHQGRGALEFKTKLALDELGRLAKVAARPGGIVVANGTAKLDATNNYRITGNLEGRDLSFSQGAQRIRNINLTSAIDLDKKRVDLKGLRLSALGAQFRGAASLEEFARYRVNGNLSGLDLQTTAATLGQKPLPYGGVVSGSIQAHGNLKASGTTGLTASARLSIAPSRRGIPLSGRLNVEYDGAAGNIALANSYLALPNTRLNLSGSLNRQLNLELTTRSLQDLLAVVPAEKRPAIAIESGQARFVGTATGRLSSPRIAGHVSVDRFSVQGRRFDALSLDLEAASDRARVSNGLLRRGPLEAQFSASTGLRNWSSGPNQDLNATIAMHGGDLADVMALAGQPPAGFSGALSLDANVMGTVGNPVGLVAVQVLNGTIKDEPFDRIHAKVNLTDQLVTIPEASVAAGPTRLSLTAEYRHPRDSFTTGQLHARLQGNQIELARIRTLQRQRPNTQGVVSVNADITGNLTSAKVNGKDTVEFLLSSVTGDVAARDLRFDGRSYGDLSAKARTSGQTINYDAVSNFAGADIRVVGTTQLVKDYPTTATANVTKLPIERLLALARRADVPARGVLSGTAQVKGTIKNPEGSLDLDLVQANLYDEPIDHVRAKVNYQSQRVEVSMFEAVAGPSRIELTGNYSHPAGNFRSGDLQFHVKSSRIDLARIQNIRTRRPGLAGVLRIAAAGSASVRPVSPKILFRDLNADIGATGLASNGKALGDVNFKATTTAGRLNFALDSNFADAAIHGRGEAQLSGDHPLNAELNFQKVRWSHLQPFLGATTGQPDMFDAIVEGQVTARGPMTNVDRMQGSLRVARLEITTTARRAPTRRAVTIHNEGPLLATLNNGVVSIDRARMVGPQTEITASGNVPVADAREMDVKVSARTNLVVVESFHPDIYSSGEIVMGATVRGRIARPSVTGQLELKNASINHVDLPNGLSNANGLVIFSGNTATIRTMTAQSGGGKVTLSGFVVLTETLRLGLRATAIGVRVRTQQGVSIVANAFVNVTGTQQSSLAAGNVIITRITYAPQSDIGSILTRVAPPVQAPRAPNPLLDNMRLDIRVRSSSSTTVQASVAQNVQLDADLRIRGTAARPGVLGRIQITEGVLVFFGSEYRVTSGTISFYNPVRIEPILNISLETQAKGVNVVLTVTGPVDNMKLSYTSDPPLQFQEIVSLLAAGRTPTSDPTILANQPSQPQQSFQQMGETAIVGKAIADPVANRLARVFGVTQLKIDPTFTNGSNLPQARVTLQQRVTSNVTFTYVTALDDPNTQIIQIEWALNRNWSAVAIRDENGMFSLNFQYSKQFR